MRTKELFTFIRARHCVYLMREAGNHKPWTGDPILQQYRFCNVYRELDPVTIWIAENWRRPNENDKYLWFAMVVARLFNNPDTLNAMGYPLRDKRRDHIDDVPWDRLRSRIAQHKENGYRIFNPAYIVSTNGVAMDKVEYLLTHVLGPMWEDRGAVNSNDGTLISLFERLSRFVGLGSFMAAQVVADMKYTPRYLKAPDWMTFAMSGPGSRRGLNRVVGNAVKDRWREDVWRVTLMALQKEVNPLMLKHEYQPLHAQDLQNCLCEFDKYERVRLGEGRPKQRYNGGYNG